MSDSFKKRAAGRATEGAEVDMKPLAEALAGVILYGPDPGPLAAFYRDALGIPFETHTHGPVKEHQEAWFPAGTQPGARVHVALWGGPARIVPSFRVANVEDAARALVAAGATALHPVLELGEGKRLVSLRDPGGNEVRVIEIRE